jgi:hypothetical protein
MHLNSPLAQTSFSILSALRDAFASMGRDIIDFTPKLAVSLIITFVGWVIGLVVARTLISFFARTGLDRLFHGSSLSNSFSSAGIKIPPGALLGKAAFWLILLFSLKAAADNAGLRDLSDIVAAVFRFLPKAIVAIIIVATGFFVADLLRRATIATLGKLGLDYAKTLGSLVFGFVLVIVLTVALAQLGIQAGLLIASVEILLGSLALAMALALGLGLRDAAGGLIAGVYAKDVFKPGTTVEIGGEPCIIQGIGPLTAKLLRSDGSFLVIPNTRLTLETIPAHPAVEEIQ